MKLIRALFICLMMSTAAVIAADESTGAHQPLEQDASEGELLTSPKKHPYGSPGSASHILGSTKDLAHYYSTSLGGFGIFLANYLGKVTQALALTTKNPHAMRGLYTFSLATRTVDGTANIISGLTATPGQSRSEAPLRRHSLIGRLLQLWIGGEQISKVPFNFKLLANAGKLSRLYKKQPRLYKSLRRIRNKRILNATLSLGISLVTSFIVHLIAKQMESGNSEDDTAIRVGLSMFISRLISATILNRRSEEIGIENELIAHAQRLSAQEKKPFFNPPARVGNANNPTSDPLMRLKPHEVKLNDHVAELEDEFEELTVEDLNKT